MTSQWDNRRKFRKRSPGLHRSERAYVRLVAQLRTEQARRDLPAEV